MCYGGRRIVAMVAEAITPIAFALILGGCQNYGSFLGTLNIRCRTILGTQTGTIILTATQYHEKQWPYCSDPQAIAVLHIAIAIVTKAIFLGFSVGPVGLCCSLGLGIKVHLRIGRWPTPQALTPSDRPKKLVKS